MKTATWLAAALLMLPHAASAELGRLFFTQAQRNALDMARKQNIRLEIGNEETERQQNGANAAPLPQTVHLNGMIQRSDGNNTVWLNDKPITGQNAAGMSFLTNRNDSKVKLQLPDGGRSMDLKVGQTAEINSGTVEESYNRRSANRVEDKALTGPTNVVAGVQKRTADSTSESIESPSRLPRKSRPAQRGAADEAAMDGNDTR
jgi:hypothetical protein